MGGEVSHKTLVMQFEKAQGVLLLRASKENLPWMMCEFGKMYTIFLAGYALCLLPLFDIENGHLFVIGSRNQEVTGIVKV